MPIACLGRSALTAQAVIDPDIRIPSADMMMLSDRAASMTKDAAFGLHVGERTPENEYGLMGDSAGHEFDLARGTGIPCALSADLDQCWCLQARHRGKRCSLRVGVCANFTARTSSRLRDVDGGPDAVKPFYCERALVAERGLVSASQATRHLGARAHLSCSSSIQHANQRAAAPSACARSAIQDHASRFTPADDQRGRATAAREYARSQPFSVCGNLHSAEPGKATYRARRRGPRAGFQQAQLSKKIEAGIHFLSQLNTAGALRSF